MRVDAEWLATNGLSGSPRGIALRLEKTQQHQRRVQASVAVKFPTLFRHLAWWQ